MFWEAVLFLVPLSFILYFFLARRWSRTSKLVPPGPRQLPLLGNLLDILTFNHMTMRDLAKKYGDIYLMNIMGHKVFVVTNIDLAREALVRKGYIFAGRSFSYVIHALFKEKEAILFGDYGGCCARSYIQLCECLEMASKTWNKKFIMKLMNYVINSANQVVFPPIQRGPLLWQS